MQPEENDDSSQGKVYENAVRRVSSKKNRSVRILMENLYRNEIKCRMLCTATTTSTERELDPLFRSKFCFHCEMVVHVGCSSYVLNVDDDSCESMILSREIASLSSMHHLMLVSYATALVFFSSLSFTRSRYRRLLSASSLINKCNAR